MYRPGHLALGVGLDSALVELPRQLDGAVPLLQHCPSLEDSGHILAHWICPHPLHPTHTSLQSMQNLYSADMQDTQ